MPIKPSQISFLVLALALLALRGTPAAAASGHYSGGSGGSGSLEGRCIRWAVITDGGAADAGDAGASAGGALDGGTDGGANPNHIGEVCVEHAGLFSCAVASPDSGAARTHSADPLTLAMAGALASFLFVALRRRAAASHG